MNYWLEGIKLMFSGLMVILELIGVNNPNQVVIDAMQKVGIGNPYQMDKNAAENNKPIDEIKTVDIEMPDRLPYVNDEWSYPVVEATSAIAISQTDGSVLWEKNADEQRAMASTTKLMTAIVALEQLKLDQVISIIAADTQIEPNVMGLAEGEQINVRTLLQGLLIGSNNDAALALARAAGGGDIKKFVELMNEKAIELNLKNTHFANPHGLDADNHYSTARDLAMLAKYAFDNEFIAQTVILHDLTVYSEDRSMSHQLETTNELLDSYLDIRGGKTGFTDNAGQVLICSAAGQDNNKIITVVMNSPDRFQETKSVIDWVWGNFYWD